MAPKSPQKISQDWSAGIDAQGRFPRVPDALMKKHHDALEHFHKARGQLEQTMNGYEHRHVEHVNQNEIELQKAEQELEQIDKEIRATLGMKEPSSSQR